MNHPDGRDSGNQSVIGVFPVGTITRAAEPEYRGLLRHLGPVSKLPFRVDVEDDSAVFKVVAELPGVSPQSIELVMSPSREALTILAERGGERVGREVFLPHPAKAESLDAHYANGELHVWIARASG